MTQYRRSLRRSDDAWIGGVIGGIAEHFGLDVSLCRAVYAILAIPSLGTLIFAYLVMWVIIPAREGQYRY